MKNLQASLASITTTGVVLAVAWCSGIDFERSPRFGFVLMLAIALGLGAFAAVSED